MLPDNLPSVRDAKLPATYQRARAALEKCTKVDECATWGKKAAALASYAKQADDDSLYKMAVKIRARAIRKCGELLSQIKAAQGGDRGNAATGPRRPVGETRTSAADGAGLSDRQKKTALRIAGVSGQDFEAAVERERPATIKELAAMGTKPKPKPLVDLKGRDPDDFQAATQALGRFRDFTDFIRKVDVEAVLRGASITERNLLKRQADESVEWLTAFLKVASQEKGAK